MRKVMLVILIPAFLLGCATAGLKFDEEIVPMEGGGEAILTHIHIGAKVLESSKQKAGGTILYKQEGKDGWELRIEHNTDQEAGSAAAVMKVVSEAIVSGVLPISAGPTIFDLFLPKDKESK